MFLETTQPGKTETARKSKPKIKTLEHLISWLEKQPADTAYCFTDNSACVLAQYKRSYSPRSRYAILNEFPRCFMLIAGLDDGDWTFGAALLRARASRSDS